MKTRQIREDQVRNINLSESESQERTMNATINSSESESWENWIDVWAGFWLEGVALPFVAVFGIIGEKFEFCNADSIETQFGEFSIDIYWKYPSKCEYVKYS